MNLNVFQSSSTSVSVQSPLPVSSSASVHKPIQDETTTTTTEPTKPSSKSIINPVLTVYSANVVNAPLSWMDEQENSRSEAVQARNKTTSKKRLYWWLQSHNNSK